MRLIVLSSLIASVGFGLYISGSAVYFVAGVGLSPVQVGLGLALASFMAVPLGLPTGHLADRFGAREVLLGLTFMQAVMLLAATQVRSFWAFLVVITLLGIAEQCSNVARAATIAGIVGKEGRVRVAAYSRSVFNIGFSVGVFFAGLAIVVDTRWAYVSLMVGNAVTALIVCLITLRLPKIPGATAAATVKSSRQAVRDYPYVAVAVISGASRIGDTILTVGLPLWIVGHTAAPRPLAAWLIMANTVLVILLQVRASRGAETTDGAARMQRWALLSLAAACVVAAITYRVPAWAAVVALVGVVGLLTLGELWGESARWSFRFGFAPQKAQGAYGGMFNIGSAVPTFVAPVLVTGLTDRLLGLGWLILGALFILALAASRPVLHWVQRTRPEESQ